MPDGFVSALARRGSVSTSRGRDPGTAQRRHTGGSELLVAATLRQRRALSRSCRARDHPRAPTRSDGVITAEASTRGHDPRAADQSGRVCADSAQSWRLPGGRARSQRIVCGASGQPVVGRTDIPIEVPTSTFQYGRRPTSSCERGGGPDALAAGCPTRDGPEVYDFSVILRVSRSHCALAKGSGIRAAPRTRDDGDRRGDAGAQR